MAPFTFEKDHEQKDLKEQLKKTIFEGDYMKFVRYFWWIISQS